MAGERDPGPGVDQPAVAVAEHVQHGTVKSAATIAAHLLRPHTGPANCPDPTAAAVKCSRLIGGLLQLGAVAATSMPQRDDLNGTRRGLDEPIVQVIVDATQ